MPLAEALTARPGLKPFPNAPEDSAGWSQYRDRTDHGHDPTVRLRDGVILAMDLVQPGAVSPGPPKLVADPRLAEAYDFLRDPQRLQPVTTAGASGWVAGTPSRSMSRANIADKARTSWRSVCSWMNSSWNCLGPANETLWSGCVRKPKLIAR